MRTNRQPPENTAPMLTGDYGDNYTFATIAKAEAFGLDTDTPTVTTFLHVETEYIISLNTFTKVNSAVQSTVDHLALTQMGMKAGMNMWRTDSVESIIR